MRSRLCIYWTFFKEMLISVFLYCWVIHAFQVIKYIDHIALRSRHHCETNLAQYLLLFLVWLLETQVLNWFYLSCWPKALFLSTWLELNWTCCSLAESEFGFLRRGESQKERGGDGDGFITQDKRRAPLLNCIWHNDFYISIILFS